MWGYRTDNSQPAEVRAACTPKVVADNKIGQWNRFKIRMKGDRLTVRLNDKLVIDNAQLPGVPSRGPIALQHHGSWSAKAGAWTGPPALIQFKNIYIKVLPD